MKKVAIIFIGTGRYLNFFPDYYENAENYLFPDAHNNYYVFTDGDFDGVLPDNVTALPLDPMEWPYIKLYRFKLSSMPGTFSSIMTTFSLWMQTPEWSKRLN